MNAANDRGPPRYVFDQTIDVRKIAEHFSIDEDRMREFLLDHEKEISEEIFRFAIELIEEIGMQNGIIPIEEDLPPDEQESISEFCAQLKHR